jgi:predicted HAD superfamily phosphohydrolase YqeG
MTNENTQLEVISVKLFVVSNRSDLKTAESDNAIKSIHIAFRPAGKDFQMARKKFPNLQLVHIPKSYGSTISKVMQEYLIEHNIMLIIGDVWGHRKDLDTFAKVNIPKAVFDVARDKLNKTLE